MGDENSMCGAMQLWGCDLQAIQCVALGLYCQPESRNSCSLARPSLSSFNVLNECIISVSIFGIHCILSLGMLGQVVSCGLLLLMMTRRRTLPLRSARNITLTCYAGNHCFYQALGTWSTFRICFKPGVTAQEASGIMMQWSIMACILTWHYGTTMTSLELNMFMVAAMLDYQPSKNIHMSEHFSYCLAASHDQLWIVSSWKLRGPWIFAS